MPDDETAATWSGMPPTNRRRIGGEQRIDAVPAHLSERLATTAFGLRSSRQRPDRPARHGTTVLV